MPSCLILSAVKKRMKPNFFSVNCSQWLVRTQKEQPTLDIFIFVQFISESLFTTTITIAKSIPCVCGCVFAQSQFEEK